jgi:hypothetical protein
MSIEYTKNILKQTDDIKDALTLVFGSDLSRLQVILIKGKLKWIIHIKPKSETDSHQYIHLEFIENVYHSSFYTLSLESGEKSQIGKNLSGGILEVIKPFKTL